MQIEIADKNQGTVRLLLTAEDVRYLLLALQRATFLDTPPGQQREIYNFAESLLKRLEQLPLPQRPEEP